MKRSFASVINIVLNRKAKRLSVFLAIVVLSITTLAGQIPSWVTGTPSIPSTGPLSITCNYGINMTGNVYIAVLGNYSTTDFAGSTIRNVVVSGTGVGWVARVNLPVDAAHRNLVLQTIIDLAQASKTYTVYFAAASSSGQIQDTAVRLYATTAPCPSITFLNQLTQPVKCVNQGAEAFFEVVPNANPLISGILKGTTWILDWGDGTVINYTSTADNDIPSVAMRTHVYTTVTDCNYIFSCGVKNPCGMTYSPQYVAVVHGRDQQSDGDGRLRIVNNANGSSTIQVCEGTETTITVRDNSIWNCQNPVVPTGFTAQPNLEPREIEWLYGRNPGGAPTNTITGNVAVATFGNAPQASGRFSPVPYGPGSLAKAVTIPATCKAGEYFRIYLKNWNKCNWTDPEYISTYVDILVIAAPPAPTVADRTICFGDPTTLTVTSSAIGTITWYADAGLSTVLGTGSTYNPVISTHGTYHYWVTDQSLSGLMCRSKATKVTLNVIQTLTNNSISAAQNICYNTTPSSLTGTSPGGGTGIYSYQWQISSNNKTWNDIDGANGINYSPGNMTSSRYFRRVVKSGPCNNNSNSILITVYGPLNGGQIRSNQSICYNTDPAGFTNYSSPSGGTSRTYSWEWSPAGGNSWNTIPGAQSLAFNENTDLTASRDYRRVTTSGAGCGTAYSNVLTVTVYNDINPGSIGSNQTICSGDNPVLLTQTSAPSGGVGTYTYQWQSSTNNIDFNNIPGANYSTYDPPVLTETTYYRRNVTSGSCGTKSTNSIKVTVNPLPTPSITGNTGPCLNYTEEYSTANITGHTYSWSVTNGHIDGVSNSYKVKINWDMASGPASVSVTERITATTCIKTAILNLTVNPAAPGAAGAITGLSNICYAQSGVTYSITPVANASNYVWSVPAGVNIVSGQGTTSIVVNFTASAVSPVTISVYPENGCGSGGSSSKVITIYSQLNGGTIGSDQTICNGDNVSAFTSSAPATGGVGSFTYTWQYTTNMAIPVGDPGWNNIASSNSETYDYGTLTTTTRFVRRAVDGTCSTPVYSNIITVTVRPALNGGTVGSNQTICYGADVAAFSSSNPASGGEGVFTYQWQYTTNATAPLGDPAWSDIATATGLTYNHDTLTTTTRFVRRAIEGTCTTPVYSNILVVTVRPQLDGGAIGTDQTICYNTDVAAFTSSNPASGGAGSFTYTWQYTTNMTIPAGDPAWVNIPSSNTATYNYGTLTATTRFIRRAVEGICTTPVYSNEVKVTVRPVLDGGIIAGNQTICSGGDVEAFTSTTAATGGAGSFTYTWQYTTNMSATPGDGNWTDIGSSNNEIYNHGTLTTTTRFVRKAVDATCTQPVYSNVLTITVMPALNPGAIGSDHTICSGTDVPAFTSLAPASGGAGSFTYTWQYTTNMSASPGDGNWTDINSSNSLEYDFGTLTAKTMFVRKAEDISCTSPVYSNVVTVSINPLPVTSAITGPSVLCEDATNKVYQVVNTPGSTYAWTVPASIDNTMTPGLDNLYFIIVNVIPGMATSTDTIYVTETITSTGCVGKPVKFHVNIVDIVPGVVVSGPASLCLGDTATYSVPDNSASTYSWSIPPGAYIVSGSNSHSIEVTFKMTVTGDVSVIENSGGVCNTVHTPVTVIVNPLPTIFNLTAPVAYCDGEEGVTITLSGSQADVNYQLYNSLGPVDVPLPGTGSALTWPDKETETYYVIATNATTGCQQMMNGTVVPTVNLVDGGEIGSEQAVCENSSPAAFTSVVAGTAGGVLTYQWQRSTDNSTWTNIPGATSAVYASGPLSANTYFRRMAISTMGSSVCQDTSNSVLVTVIIFNPGSIGSDISICEGTAPADPFASVAPSGTGTFTYRWLSSTDGVNYSPAGITTETFTPGVLNVDTWFKREVTATYLTRSCIGETNSVKVTVINFSPGSIGSDQTICSGTAPAPFTSVAPTGDGSFTYSWESSPDGNVPWTSLGISTPTYTSLALSADTYFRRAVTSTHGGTSCTLYSNTIHVTVNDFDPGTIGTAKTICEGDNSGLLNSVLPASGDPSATFTYQWLSSTDGINFSSVSEATNESYTSGSLLVDTYFRRQVTATLNGRACIELTPAILIKVNNLTPGSIDGAQTVCEGEIPSTFTETAAAVADGSITYQWQESANGINGWTNVASGGDEATYTPPAALAEDMWFKRLVTSTFDGVSCTKESNIIKVTVNNFQPGSISGNQSICENSAAAPLTSVSPSGDGTFTYMWKRSTDGTNFSPIGASGETYNPGILSQDTWYRRIVRSTVNGKTCVDSSDVVKITVLNFDPGSITGEQIICEGDMPAVFGSTPANGDGDFTYEWKISTNGIVFTPIPLSNVEVYSPPAGLTVDTWYKRAVTSTDGIASCTLETNTVKITVINFNPGSIASDQTICEGSSPATFTSVAASGDGIKSYQWQYSTDSTNYNNVPSGGLNATYTSDPLTQKTWFRRISYATIDTKTCSKLTDTIRVKVISLEPGVIGTNQTICEGEIPALLTETTPASGNGTLTYLWQSSLDNSDWNNITGATSITYAPGALSRDTYFRRQVTATLDGRTCTEWTPSVIVRVNNLTPGSISGTQTICEGDIPVQLTETSAGTSDFGHTYQWQMSINGTDWIDVPSDGNNPAYAPPALIQDTWYKRLITSTVDLHTCLEESNIIKVTVNNFNPGSIEEDQTICENTSAALLTSITPTGDGIFSYRWFRSTDGTNFGPIGGALNETYNPGILTQDTWYYREVKSTLNGKECVEITNPVQITVNNLTPGSISGDQIICEGGDPTAFISGGTLTYDGTVSYMWQSSTDEFNFTDIGVTDETYDSPALYQDTWFRRAVTSTIGLNTCTEYTNPVRVTVINFAPGAIGSSQTICEGATPAPFTSVAASGDGTKSYQWQFSTDSINYSNVSSGGLTANYSSGSLTQDTWFRRLSSATVGSVKCTEITDTIKVTVINFDPGTISGAQTICENDTPAAFTSTADALGDGLKTYQWQASLDGINFTNITGATENVYAHGSMTTDTWFRRQATATLNGFQCTEWTDAILVTVNNMTPGSISGTQTICEDVTPSAFTSVPATGDGNITYQWMQSTNNGEDWVNVPSGGDVEIYVAPKLVADMWYKRVATSTAGGVPCVEESNVIKVTVNNFNPGNIAAEQTICENTTPAPFTSITPGGDGVFTYRWFNSSDNLTFNLIPAAVSETYSPGILSQDTWYFREVTSTVGTNKCIARTDTIKITVNNFDPGNITGSQIICEDSAPSEFTETAPAVSNDGSIITYQWQDSPDGIFFTNINLATGPAYTSPALSADTWFRRAVKSTLGSNECTEYSDIIKVTVINFAPGSIGSDQTICEGTAPTPFTSVAASGDGTKSYQWQISDDGVAFTDIDLATNATYTSPVLTQDTWFRRLSTATVGSYQCTEITDTIKITVINFDPGTISADQVICEGDTPAEIISPAANGDGTFAYQWQSSTDGSAFSGISGATSLNYAPGALTVDTWFKRQVTAIVNGMSCIKFTPVVEIKVNNLQPGSIGGAQTICVNGTPAVLTSVNAATGDGTISYQWQESNDNGTTWVNVPSDGNGLIYAPPALSADMLYKRIAISDVGGKICPAESNTVKITVVNFDPGSIGDDQTICEGTAPDALTSNVSPSGDGSFTYKWYRSTDNSTWLPIPGAESETYSPGILTQDTWYYRAVTASIGATSCSANTNKVLITVNNFLPGSLDPDQTICEGDDPVLINGVAPSGDGLSYTYKWYESLDGTVFTEIASATSATYDPPALSVDTWYKRVVTSHLNSNACTKETTPVRIWVINFNPGTIGTDQTICEDTAPASFTGTAPSGDGSFTYSWEFSINNGTDWNPVPGDITTATYSAPALTVDTWYRRIVTSSLNGFTCSKTTPVVIVTVNNFNPGSIDADQTICEGETPAAFGSVAPSGDGTFTYQWQSSLNGTSWSNITGETDEKYSAGALAADTWYRRLVTSTLNNNTCTEPTASIKVTVNNVTAGAIGSDQIICEGSDPDPLTSVTPVFDGNVSYEWQSSTNGTDFSQISGADGETYDPPALNEDTWYKRIVTSTLNGVLCSKESNVVKITVNNFNPGSISEDQTICEGTAPAPILSVTPTGDGIFSYRWFRSTNGTDFNDEIYGALSETYNPGNLIADTWYRREVTSTLGTNTCTVLNDPVKITVNNLDPGLVSGEQVICEGVIPSVITGTAANGDGNISYQWRISNDGVNYTDITSDGQDQNYTPGALVQDTWFLRTATSDIAGQKCTEISGSFRVRVNNVNAGTIISDQTICNGSDPVAFISVVHGMGDGNITYEWQSSTDGSSFDPIASSDNPSYDSPALTQDTWFRRITRSDIDGNICEKISNLVKVTVNEVYGGEIASNQSICFGKMSVPLTSKNDGSGTGSLTYQWQRSADGVIWNTISGETGTTYSPGVLYSDTWYKRVLISIQNGVLCQAESNPVKITVNSLPVAVLTGGETICPKDQATLSISITNGTPPYILDIENHGEVTINTTTADIFVSPLVTTSYKLLKVTDVNGCEAVNMVGAATVVVRELPEIVTGPSPRVTCEYGVVKFEVVATGTDLVYQWYVDKKDGLGFIPLSDAGIYYGAQTPILNLYGVTRDMDGYMFHVTVTTCGSTKQSADVKLTVNTVPEIVQQPKDTTICSTDDAAFMILATGTNLTYRWQYKPPSGGFSDVVDGGIFTGATDSILYLSDVPLSYNNYLFRVIVDGTCGSELYSNFVALRVNGPPVPVMHPKDRSVCDGSGPVFFVANGAGIIDSIRWQVSKDKGSTWEDIYDDSIYSGTTSQQLSLINVPFAYNNYWYRLALKAFCETTYTNHAVLTVNELPVVTFAQDPIPACGGVPLVITPNISDGTAPWKSHSWSGDIGPLNNYFSPAPTFKTLIAGTYNLSYRVVDDNMCAGEGTVSVVVDSPDASFIQDISMKCTPATVKFSKDMTGLKSWEWDFGDGTPVNTTDATVEHIFTNTTSTAIVYRTIKLTVEAMSGCKDSTTSMMTIYPAIIAKLTASDDSVCHGNKLTFTADPGANIYKWDYGDGTPVVPGINTSTHIFSNPEGVPVVRTVEVVTTSLYGCSDSTTIDIVVMPMPQAQFSATPNNQTFNAAGNDVSFKDETKPESTWTYNWDFGDGAFSTEQNPQHKFTGIGTYNVVLTVTNGKCSSNISHPVTILPLPPVADFDSIPSGCATWTISPVNTSLNTDVPGTTYRWDFGDGSYSTAREPAYTYFTPGEYRVELTVTGPGGVSMKSQVVRAYPSPKAYFEVSPTLVFANDEKVRCFNLSEGGDYFVWAFGDGDTSRMRDPYHKYMEEGVYDITLWAYSNNGCSDVFLLSPGVTVQPAGDLRFSTVFIPNKTGPIERTDLPQAGIELDQFFFPPIRDKVIKYKLQIFNRLGVLIFESHNINVPWNGYYKGKLCPQGVYVWYVEGKYANGEPFKKVGDITLLH